MKQKIIVFFLVFLFFSFIFNGLRLQENPKIRIDLIKLAKKAHWYNDLGEKLTFPGKFSAEKGFVRYFYSTLEDGTEARPSLITHPRISPKGWIEGKFKITLPRNPYLEAEICFLEGAKKTTGVIYEIYWMENNRKYLLVKNEKKYNHQTEVIRINLKDYERHSGKLFLRVKAGDDPVQDLIAWKKAVICLGPPSPVSVISKVPPKLRKPSLLTKKKKPLIKTKAPLLQNTDILLSNIEKANKRIKKYRISSTLSPPGISWNGIIDEENQLMFLEINAEQMATGMEIFQVNNRAYGRPIGTYEWLNLISGKRFPSVLTTITEIIKNTPVATITKENELIRLELQVDMPSIRENPENYLKTILSPTDFAEARRKGTLSQIIPELKNISFSYSVWVGAKNFKIKKLLSQVNLPSSQSILQAEFIETTEEVPSFHPEELKATNIPLPFQALFFRLSPKWGIGGWSDITHCSWAYRSLKLIQDTDEENRYYSEIYNLVPLNFDNIKSNCYDRRREEFIEPTENHHPIVIGAYYEDQKDRPDFYETWLGSDVDQYCRNHYRRPYNHFGYRNLGLPFRWYYIFWDLDIKIWPPDIDYQPPPPRYCGSDNYFSARDWGYGGSRNGEGICTRPVSSLTKMTFVEAIKQYARQTEQGKKNAYLMLGHVLHLLQDVAEPDHAQLVPHPGSGFTEKKAYEKFKVCLIKAVNAAINACRICLAPVFLSWACTDPTILLAEHCSQAAFSITLIVCKRNLKENEVGFEWLGDNVWELSRVDTRINALGITKYDSYDTFFEELGRYAVRQVKEHNLESDYEGGNSLGCGPLQVVFLPDLTNPDILNEATLRAVEKMATIPATDPNIDLRDPIEKEKYLSLIDDLAVQAISTGAGFIEYFFETVNPPPYIESIQFYQNSILRYELKYDDIIDHGAVSRREATRQSYTLYHGLPTQIKVRFGPRTLEGTTRKMRNTLIHIGTQRIPLVERQEGDDWVYVGEFQPPCVHDLSPHYLPLHLKAKDGGIHLRSRTPYGDDLDLYPESPAYASSEFPHNWENYEPAGPEGVRLDPDLTYGVPGVYLRIDNSSGEYRRTNTRIYIEPNSTTILTLHLVETESGELACTGPAASRCGHYFVELVPTIDQIGEGGGIRPRDHGFTYRPDYLFDQPIQSEPGEFGLSIIAENTTSNEITLNIHASINVQNGLYHAYLLKKYEFSDGTVADLGTKEIEIQVLSTTDIASEEEAFRQAAEKTEEKSTYIAKKLGFLDLTEGPATVFDPCKSGVLPPAVCLEMARTKAAALSIKVGQKIAVISQDKNIEKMDMASSGITVKLSKDNPQLISFEKDRRASSGIYIIPIEVTVPTRRAAYKFLAVVTVR